MANFKPISYDLTKLLSIHILKAYIYIYEARLKAIGLRREWDLVGNSKICMSACRRLTKFVLKSGKALISVNEKIYFKFRSIASSFLISSSKLFQPPQTTTLNQIKIIANNSSLLHYLSLAQLLVDVQSCWGLTRMPQDRNTEVGVRVPTTSCRGFWVLVRPT